MTPARLSTIAPFSPARPVLVELRSARRTNALYAGIILLYAIPSDHPDVWWRWGLAVAYAAIICFCLWRASQVGKALDGVSA